MAVYILPFPNNPQVKWMMRYDQRFLIPLLVLIEVLVIITNQVIHHVIHVDWPFNVPTVSFTCFENHFQRAISTIGFGVLGGFLILRIALFSTFQDNFVEMGHRIGWPRLAKMCVWTQLIAGIGVALQGMIHIQDNMWDVFFSDDPEKQTLTTQTIIHLTSAAFFFYGSIAHAVLSLTLYRVARWRSTAYFVRVAILISILCCNVMGGIAKTFYVEPAYTADPTFENKLNVLTVGGFMQISTILWIMIFFLTYCGEEPLFFSRGMAQASLIGGNLRVDGRTGSIEWEEFLEVSFLSAKKKQKYWALMKLAGEPVPLLGAATEHLQM